MLVIFDMARVPDVIDAALSMAHSASVIALNKFSHC